MGRKFLTVETVFWLTSRSMVVPECGIAVDPNLPHSL